MILTIILSSLLGIFIVLSLILFFKLKKTKTSLGALSGQVQNMKLQTTYRFDDDIAFLTYIVGFKCKVYKDLILNPSTELSDTKFLKGEDQEEAVYTIVDSVLNSLSDEYIKLLLKYFTLDSLKEFIIELVLNQITSTITELNNNKLKKFVRSAIENRDITFKRTDIDENQPTNK